MDEKFNSEYLNKKLNEYIDYLNDEEKEKNTIKRYKTNITSFIAFVDDKPITKETIKDFKRKIDEENNYLSSTANNYLISINLFLRFIGLENLKVKLFKSQQKSKSKEYINYTDYHRLLRISERYGYDKINMIMQVLAETGIRIDELKYFTIENLKESLIVKNKGKKRTIILSKKLIRKIKNYCKRNNIMTGIVFPGKKGVIIHSSTIRKNLKKIAGLSKVKLDKVHPHSFRHYFAIQFYEAYRDLPTLSYLLGHSSIETTKIYLELSDKEKERMIRNVKF